MTEAEYNSCADPARMLAWLNEHTPFTGDLRQYSGPSDRKFRLFACACCRHPSVWSKLTDDAPCPRCKETGEVGSPFLGVNMRCLSCGGMGRINRSRLAVETAERYADGLASSEQLCELCYFGLGEQVEQITNLGLLVRFYIAHDVMAAVASINVMPGHPEIRTSILRHLVPWPGRGPLAAVCPRCQGRGRPSYAYANETWLNCELCSGRGWLPPSLPVEKCRECKGTGLDYTITLPGAAEPRIVCKACHGTGSVPCWPSAVVDLAQALYDGQDCAAILGDAIEESGLPMRLAEHFRKEARHPRGCAWLDRILDKK